MVSMDNGFCCSRIPRRSAFGAQLPFSLYIRQVTYCCADNYSEILFAYRTWCISVLFCYLLRTLPPEKSYRRLLKIGIHMINYVQIRKDCFLPTRLRVVLGMCRILPTFFQLWLNPTVSRETSTHTLLTVQCLINV